MSFKFGIIHEGSEPDDNWVEWIFNTAVDDMQGFVSGKFSAEAGKAENLEFAVTKDFNRYYTLLSLERNTKCVFMQNNKILSICRISSRSTDFDNILSVAFDGYLSILSDTYQPPKMFVVTPGIPNVRQILQSILNDHNSQAHRWMQCTIGFIDYEYESVYIHDARTNYDSSYEAIKSIFLKKLGGVILPHYTYDSATHQYGIELLYLSHLGSHLAGTNPPIEFGHNLLDITAEENIDEIVDAIIPLGAKLEHPTVKDERLNISSVNDGKVYLVRSGSSEENGLVYKTEIFDDITSAGTLKSAGENIIKQLKPKKNIVATAYDLSLVDDSETAFSLGGSTTIDSTPHRVFHQVVNVTKISLNLVDLKSCSVTVESG